jgi:hypothetical protein
MEPTYTAYQAMGQMADDCIQERQLYLSALREAWSTGEARASSYLPQGQVSKACIRRKQWHHPMPEVPPLHTRAPQEGPPALQEVESYRRRSQEEEGKTC